MSFFEFVEQIAFIIKNLPISFWISVAIVSPLFMKFEGLVQTGLQKSYILFLYFPKKYPTLLSFLGFLIKTCINNFKSFWVNTRMKKIFLKNLK